MEAAMPHANRFEIEPPPVVLFGIVDDRRINDLRNRIFAHSDQLVGIQIVDCSRTIEFSGMALVLLSALIKEVREAGGDLLLLELPEKIRLSMSDKLIEDLIPPFLVDMVRKLVREARAIAPAVPYANPKRMSLN